MRIQAVMSHHSRLMNLRWIVSLSLAAALTVGFYSACSFAELPGDHLLVRYTAGHWIEYVEVAFFLWGMSQLLVMLVGYRKEYTSLSHSWLPRFTGPMPASEAGHLISAVENAPRRLQRTILGRRLRAALVDVADRQASEHLDDYLKDLAEQSANEAHGQFALPKVIAWAIPILGFLGTVMGITLAIANITPTQLEESLPEVTGGLAVAFDTTALALLLSMGLIFTLFVVERVVGNLLASVEQQTRRLISNRFLSSTPESTPYLSAVHAASAQVIAHTQQLIERQSALWAKAMEGWSQRLEEMNARRDQTFSTAVDKLEQKWKTDATHLEKAYRHSEEIQARLERLADLLIQKSVEEKSLVAAQDRLVENLRLLRETQGFDEALHSLTAAVHLLTIRAGAVADRQLGSTGPRERNVA